MEVTTLVDGVQGHCPLGLPSPSLFSCQAFQRSLTPPCHSHLCRKPFLPRMLFLNMAVLFPLHVLDLSSSLTASWEPCAPAWFCVSCLLLRTRVPPPGHYPCPQCNHLYDPETPARAVLDACIPTASRRHWWLTNSD